MVHIFELIGKKSVSRVLQYFLERPTAQIHAQKLGKIIRMAKKTMLDALRELVVSGMLEVAEIGRTKQYRLRRNDTIVRQLKILHSVSMLSARLKKFEGEGVEIYLYGSAARGEDTEKSDVDILLVGDVPKDAAAKMLSDISSEERFKPIYLTFMDYSGLARRDRPFYERLEKDRIRLV